MSLVDRLKEGTPMHRRRWTGDVGEFSLVDEAAADELLLEAARRIEKLTAALDKLRDCDWVITLPDRMDAVREIAREALNE